MKGHLTGRRGLRLAALAFILAGLALLLPLWGLAGAQEAMDGPPRWELSPADPRVGDPLTLTLEVAHPADERLVLPILPAQWGPLELVAQGAPQTLPQGAGGGSRVTLQARAFVTGSLATPPLTLRLVNGAGRLREVEAPPALVQVRPTLRSAAELPRDLRSQAPLPPRRPWTKALAMAVAAGGLLLAFSGLRGVRPLPPPPPAVPAPPPDPRAAWRQALADLDQLEALGLLAQGRVKAHYSLAIDILRRYLAERWGLPALDQTSAELLAQLAAAGRPAAAAAYLAPLLQEADLVKFARLTPDEARAAGLTGRLRELLTFWEDRG